MSTARSSTCQFPRLSWNSSDSTLTAQMLQATDGVMLIDDIGIQVPVLMESVKKIFCELDQDISFTEALNNLEPTKRRRPCKFKALWDRSVDQKRILDFSPSTMNAINENGLYLSHNFFQIQDFSESLKSVVSRLVRLAAKVITNGTSSDSSLVEGIHYRMNCTHRLVEFFPIAKKNIWCGAHRDITTFTLILQDTKGHGGLEVFTKSWKPVPATSEAVLMWGWSTFILSNGRLPAPLHRVSPRNTVGSMNDRKRYEFVLYMMPDWDAYLRPVLSSPCDQYSFHLDALRNLTVRHFKDLFESKWHQREGTTTEQEEQLLASKKVLEEAAGFQMSQDEDILTFLLYNKVMQTGVNNTMV